MEQVPTITVRQLAEAIAAKTPLMVLDVREDTELATSAIPGVTHIPLGELPQRLEELDKLDPETPIAVICRSGGRSARATAFLLSNGFNAANVAGGMQAYVAEVDLTLPTP